MLVGALSTEVEGGSMGEVDGGTWVEKGRVREAVKRCVMRRAGLGEQLPEQEEEEV